MARKPEATRQSRLDCFATLAMTDEGSMHLYPLIRPLAFALEPEVAHRATIAALKLTPTRRPPDFPDSLRTTVAGLDFPSPIGLAPGFDKNAEVPEPMRALASGS